jgi:ABC-2 type transport system ATP-binding protein
MSKKHPSGTPAWTNKEATMNQGRAAQDGHPIVIRDLTKRFGDLTAVKGLNLEIHQGEMFGLLGPNGAGKTTTIHMLCGLLAPTAGTATVAGHDVTHDGTRMKAHIGVCRQRTTALLEGAGFVEAAARRAKGYSGGMMRQLNLLMALISDPEMVFLDEPTVGMDARARRRTWEYIGSLKEQGKTVILTTHYIEEAQALSDRVGIIDYGELIALGTPAALMAEHKAKDLESVFLSITGRRIAEGS